MGCSNKKDLSRMVATARVLVKCSPKRRRIISPDGEPDGRFHKFIDVYLWEDLEALYRNVAENTPENGVACLQPMPTFWGMHPLLAWSSWLDLKLFQFVNSNGGNKWTARLGWPRFHIARKLGEIHFAGNWWSKFVVSHECLHLTLLLARDAGALDQIRDDIRGDGYHTVGAEEDFCTMHQSLFADVYGFLREHDPEGELHK